MTRQKWNSTPRRLICMISSHNVQYELLALTAVFEQVVRKLTELRGLVTDRLMVNVPANAEDKLLLEKFTDMFVLLKKSRLLLLDERKVQPATFTQRSGIPRTKSRETTSRAVTGAVDLNNYLSEVLKI